MYSRILICGGRTFSSDRYFQEVMSVMQPQFAPKFVIIHGGAKGADLMADRWAKLEGVPVIRMDANWAIYQLAAGSLRNSWMLDWALPDCVIALPGNRGTADMIKQATERGLPVFK